MARAEGTNVIFKLHAHLFTLKVISLNMCLQAATKKQKYEKISEKKMSTPVEVLCKVSISCQRF